MSINSSKKSYGLFDDEEDFETVPFSSLEKNQRNVTKEREFYYLYTPYIAILVNIIIVRSISFLFSFFLIFTYSFSFSFCFLDLYLFLLMKMVLVIILSSSSILSFGVFLLLLIDLCMLFILQHEAEVILVSMIQDIL